MTGNGYNQRQFFYDFTGTGYTQVRIRVISIIGTNAGTVLLTVHNAPTSVADTFLFLGDSITSNCWQAGSNTAPYTNGYPNENFGLRVNALHPTRYPLMTEGGIPGQTSGSVLSTTPYGIPTIRQWLNDFPSVKYVVLSYGTNDANQGISAATYYSNMKALVQEVIAAGKTPIIPTIVASPAAAVQSNAPALNAQLATLESNYPAIIKGPDLWTLFSGHSTSDGWFFDSLHPSLDAGCSALEQAWVNTMNAALYSQ
jgi:lysophospholipase L1-like esterase